MTNIAPLRIGILDGDDIGHEIVPAAVEISRGAAQLHGPQATHGSAPDIAGRGIANPYAMIESSRMMFEWLGHSRRNEGARRMSASMARATTAALADPLARTGDIRGKGNTATFTRAVLRHLQR